MADEQIRSGGRWLTELATCGDIEWSHRWPGGCWEASWRMNLPARSAPACLRRGQLVEIMIGPTRVWYGQLNQPERGADGWNLSASGLARQGERFLCFDGSGNTTSTPDTAIDEAITRGLTWVRRDSFSSTPFVSTDSTDGLNYVAALLDAWADEEGKRWAVGPDGVVYAADDPTVPTLHMIPDSGILGLADDEYATHLFGRYRNGSLAYVTADVEDTAAADMWGPSEHPVDLTPLGLISGTRATNNLNGLLAKGAARMGWTNGLEPGAQGLLTVGGVPVDRRFVRAGQMVRLHGITDESRMVALNTDVVIGETRYSTADRSLQMTPVGLVARSLSDVLEVAAR